MSGALAVADIKPEASAPDVFVVIGIMAIPLCNTEQFQTSPCALTKPFSMGESSVSPTIIGISDHVAEYIADGQ
jgi:hypothetical protein